MVSKQSLRKSRKFINLIKQLYLEDKICFELVQALLQDEIDRLKKLI